MFSLRGLNSAFKPTWQMPRGYMPTVQVPEFSTDQLNPMWAQALDAYGASDPGGVRMNPSTALPLSPDTPHQSPDIALQGLRASGHVPYDEWYGQEKQKLAAKYPHAKG